MMKVTLLILSVSLFTWGCTSSERRATPEQLVEAGRLAGSKHREDKTKLLRRLADRAIARGDRGLDLLFLSGGGQNGAYGIGFLRGWKSREKNPIPKFDLVTGISTGALQAPFALVGTAESIETGSRLYKNASYEFAPGVDWFFWLRPTGGLLNVESYRRAIFDNLNFQLLFQMRDAQKEGRTLLVGTTDLELGVTRVWDLLDEVDQRPEGLAGLHDIIYASTAIPGIFPPQILEGRVHADGGVGSNLLTLFDLEDYQELSRLLKERGAKDAVRVRVWILMNMFLSPMPAEISPKSRNQLADRGTSLLFTLAQAHTLRRMKALESYFAVEDPVLDLEVRVTSIPWELSHDPRSQSLFDQSWMDRLEEVGAVRARSENPWDSKLPSIHLRPESH